MTEQLKIPVHTSGKKDHPGKLVPAELFFRTQMYLMHLQDAHATLAREIEDQLELSIHAGRCSVLTADLYHCRSCLGQILRNLDEIQKTLDTYGETDDLSERGETH